MRITTIRILVQIVVFSLFLFFVFVTTFSNLNDYPMLMHWVSKFLEIDPLVSIATALSTSTVYKGLIWSLLLLIPTLFLGRIFCNWICPYGIIHHFVGWVFNTRNAKERIESNRYRPLFAFKYYVLVFMLIAAVFGALQIGLLDPICLLHRSFTGSLLPAMNMPEAVQKGVGPLPAAGAVKYHQLGWLIGLVILFFVSMNLVIPRFFCRVVCPLGALLGVLSRFAVWRIERDPNKCTDCDLCLQSCEGASDPHTQLRKSECFVCFNCIEDCPHDALSFRFIPKKSHEVTNPDVPARRAVFAAVVGVLFYPFTKASGKSTRDFSTQAIRPPGAVEEQEFLERCIKCDQCIRVCPTNVLQPAGFEAGIEGLWTPVMNFRMGYCQLNCTACGQVCPTGAIQRLSVDQKLGFEPLPEALGGTGPVKLGTAHYDLGRCLPWSKNIPCVVCEEVCPTSPKAIHSEYKQLLIRDGKKQVLFATPVSVTVADYPKPGAAFGEPSTFRLDQFRGDQTTTYHVEIIHRDGTSENHRILRNDADTLIIGELDENGSVRQGGRFATEPKRGAVAAINLQFKVPKIDTALCIGCGICEHECPVVGDRRAVYVTAEGETRSENYLDRERNRSLRLMKTADAGPGPSERLDLVAMARRHGATARKAPLRISLPVAGGSGASRRRSIPSTGHAVDLVTMMRSYRA
jgi:polyferredoxin/ferredoxin